MTNSDYPSNAQAIIDAIQEIDVPEPIGPELHGLFAVGSGKKIVDLQDHIDRHAAQPRRKTGTYTMHDAASFVSYFNKHTGGEGEVFADFPATTITGVVNANMKDIDAFGDGAQWEDHRVVYRVLTTDAWKAWLANDGRLMSQVEFAGHIEDRLIDIVEPASADMLEIAQTFTATTQIQFDSANRLADGQRQLRYHEVVDAKTGRAGDMTVPEVFKLALKPFEGADVYGVVARLRYRISDGQLRIGYKLERPEDVLREAFTDVVKTVDDGVTPPVLFGSR